MLLFPFSSSTLISTVSISGSQLPAFALFFKELYLISFFETRYIVFTDGVAVPRHKDAPVILHSFSAVSTAS